MQSSQLHTPLRSFTQVLEARWKSCNETHLSSSGQFNLRKESSLTVLKLVSRVGAGSHRSIWKQEIASYSTCSERARCHSTAVSCWVTTTRFYHGASARPDVPSFLNNSERSMWCIQEQTRGILFRQHRRRISNVLTSDFCNLAFFLWGDFVPRQSKLLCQNRFANTNFHHKSSLPHVTILLNKPIETATTFNTTLCLFSYEGQQHKFWTNFFC